MKDLVIGLVVWATVVAALLAIGPKSQAEAPRPTTATSHRRVSAADRMRVHDQQLVDPMILTNGRVE
jgi:hypothetical protein